jgi:hypothetical protein
MSKYSHRSVKELKTFIKKYNEHFRIMLTGKKKPDLIREIEDGMKKSVSDELKKAHDELLIKTPKEKKPKVEKPKEQPKKTMEKEDEVRPAKKPFPPIPKNIRGKRVNVKFEKPATKERIETGEINVGKVDTTKPKIKIKIKIKKEKKVKKPTGEKVKKAVEKIEKKEEPKKAERKPETKKFIEKLKKEEDQFGILNSLKTMNRKQLEEQANFIGVSDDFASDDELRKKIKDEIKRVQAGTAILCSSEIKRLLNDLRDILSGNEKYAEIAKGYGKEKLKYADYRKNFIDGANEILKNHKKYKRECTEGELTEIRKGLKIMEDSPNVQKFNKRTPKKEEPKKEEPKQEIGTTPNERKYGVIFPKYKPTNIKSEMRRRQLERLAILKKSPKYLAEEKKEEEQERIRQEKLKKNPIREGKGLTKAGFIKLQKAMGENVEPKKEEPKKKKVNFDKIEEGLEDMDDETGAMAFEIRGSSKYNIKKPNFTEKEVFEDTKYKNMKDLERQFDILKNMSDDLTDEDEKQIALNLIENIRDRLPFIKDNIK